MSTLLVWFILLVLCAAITCCTAPVGLAASAAIMAAVTAVSTQYIEHELGICWFTLAAVAILTLFGAGLYRHLLHDKVNTAGRH